MSKLEAVLTKLTAELLRELLQGNNASVKASANKKELIAAVVSTAFAVGDKILLETIEVEHKKLALEALDSDYSETTKTKITKDFKKAFEKKGREALFEKLPREVLDKFCQDMQFEEDTTEKKDIEEALGEEVFIAGARKIFDTMSLEFIKDVSSALEVKKGKTKKLTINRILGQAYEHLLEEEVESTSTDKKKKKDDIAKPDIVKGVTSDQLFQAYYLPELREYCKTHDLLISGNRRELINRILGYLDGETKGSKTGEKKKKRRAKSEATRKALAKKKRKEREEKDKAEGKEPAKKKRKTEKPAEKSDEESSSSEEESADEKVAEKKPEKAVEKASEKASEKAEKAEKKEASTSSSKKGSKSK